MSLVSVSFTLDPLLLSYVRSSANDVAGGSASGKTSVARAILSALGYIPTVLILSQDAFYRAHTPEEIELAFANDLDLGSYTKQLRLEES